MEKIEPETESEEEDEDEEDFDDEESEEPSIVVPDDFYRSEINKLKNNPLDYICNWMEENLLHVGKRAFRLIALMPCSEIIPSIPFLSTDIRSNINAFLIGSPATGKCLHEDSLVLLSNGKRKKIKEVIKGDKVLSLDEDSLKILESNVLNKINNGSKKCFRLSTNLGREIEVTNNHPFYTIQGWKKLSELKEGDFIGVPRGYRLNCQGELNDEEIKILAYLIADGCINQPSPNFTNGNVKRLEDFITSVVKRFPELKCKSYRKENSNNFNVKVSAKNVVFNSKGKKTKNSLALFLMDIGPYGCKSSDKFVPDKVFECSNDKISLFLNRLYACDGCISLKKSKYKNPTIEYYSNSKKLCLDVQHLLLRLNIVSKLSSKNISYNGNLYRSYRLSICSLENCKRFIEKVGLVIGKEDVCKKVLSLKLKDHSNIDLIPHDIWEMIMQEKDQKNLLWKDINPRLGKSSNKKGKNHNTYRHFMREFELDVAQKYANSDLFWDKIIKITSIGERNVYDLEIEENHNFVANDFTVHNSTLVKKFLNLSYYPIRVKGISAKKLMDKIYMRDGMFSLGIDDFSNVLDQPDGYETIKILEGALGDEKTASHENMKYSKVCKTQAVGLICGTWVDLKKYSSYLKGGFLSRMSLLFISITNKQREEIADFINDGVGKTSKSTESRMKEEVIKSYYKILFDIQAKNNKQIGQIQGYYFDPNYKSMALATWKKITKEYANDINGDFKREFHDFYRYLVSHAFLNVFKRKVENGVIYPIKEDYEFALKLMEETLKNKIALIQSSIFVKQIESPAKLLKVLNSPLKEDVKNIIINLSPYGRMVGSMQRGNVENKGNITVKK